MDTLDFLQADKAFSDAKFSALSRHLPRDWIAGALEATGSASIRRRKLPAEQVVWLVIGLALYRGQSMNEVVDSLDLVLPDQRSPYLAKSALSQARHRLGEDPLAWLFRTSAAAWDQQVPSHWRGLRLYALDSTVFRTPDSVENRAHFGSQAYQSVVASYPQVRGVTLMAVDTHLVCDFAFGVYGCNEINYAKALLPSIPADSLTLLDRGFLSAEILIDMERDAAQRHWLIPAKSNTRMTRLEPHPTDYRVRLPVSPQARQRRPDLPEFFEARALVAGTVHGKPRLLLTSLMNRQQYPAREVIACYERRWQIELSYREIKQTMLGEGLTLRSQTVEGIRQELWGAMIAYNLVRRELASAAADTRQTPTRLSFVMALHYIRYELHWMAVTRSYGKLPDKLRQLREKLKLMLLDERRGRSRPRQVKAPPQRYTVIKLRRA